MKEGADAGVPVLAFSRWQDGDVGSQPKPSALQVGTIKWGRGRPCLTAAGIRGSRGNHAAEPCPAPHSCLEPEVPPPHVAPLENGHALRAGYTERPFHRLSSAPVPSKPSTGGQAPERPLSGLASQPEWQAVPCCIIHCIL